MNSEQRIGYYVLVIFVLLCALAAIITFKVAGSGLRQQDIYYAWLEGDRLSRGENFYSRIHAGDWQNNDKYATYFPLFYELSFLAQALGLKAFDAWVALWRVVFLLCNLAIAGFVFWPFFRRKQYMLALFAAALWLFNRWTLYVVLVVHLDFLAILPLVASLWLFPRRQRVAFLLLGLSLAIKQIAIFLVPLYLIWAWNAARGKPVRRTLEAAVWLGALPLLSAAPFLAWDAAGFVKSVLFSATRVPDTHLNATALQSFVGLSGVAGRLPMMGLMAVVYALAWRGTIGRYLAAFLTMTLFLDFNGVLFNQYVPWAVALLPMVVYEYLYRAEMPNGEVDSDHAEVNDEVG